MIRVLSRLLQEVKKHKKSLVIVAVTGIVYAVAYSQLTLTLKDIYNSFEKGDQTLVTQVGIWAVSLALAVALSRYFHIFTMNMIAERVVTQLRLKLQAKFMRLSLSFHGQYAAGSGGLMSRILNDIKVIQDGLRMVADLFREPLLAILLLGNLFYLNWRLTLTILILLPLILWFLRQISRSLRKYVLWGQESLEKISSTVKETLDGVRTIQSFNLEPVLSKKLDRQSEDFLGIRQKVHARIELMGPVTEFIATCVILGIFFYFSGAVAKGELTSGDVLAYIASLMAINAPIKKLQESYVRIQETVVAATRLFEILDDPSEIEESQKKLPFPKNWSKITYDNVTFSYGDLDVLSGINLEIKRGECLAFVGESGSGKSSLVNLLCRFYEPSQGEIRIDSIPIKDIDLRSLRENIALVSQDVFLFSDTIRSNIQFGKISESPRDVIPSAQAAYAHDFITQLPGGYESQVGDRGSLLSGGEKQRVSIARALYKDAPLLVLDEATSALDSASEQEVQKALDHLMRGRTSLVVAHRLSTIQNADRILVLRRGQIVEQGRHEDLVRIENGLYKKFWSLQT